MKKRFLSMLCILAALTMTMTSTVLAEDADVTLNTDTPISSKDLPTDSTSEPVQTITESALTTSESALTSSESPADVNINVSDGVIGFGSSNPTEANVDETTNEPKKNVSTVSAVGMYPFEIKYDNHNGSPIVIKSFRVPAKFDPDTLVEEDFEDTGYTYSKKDILKNEPTTKTEQKLVAQSVTFSTEDNKEATIMAALNPVIDYAEGGFSGQLELDTNSIQTVPAGQASYSYPIQKTVEYNSLDRNDYAYLDKSVDGLTLQGADWTTMGGSQRGDEIVPSSYNAKATYTGTGYGTKVTGYTNTATYKGQATRTLDGDSVYSVIYQGTKIVDESNIPWAQIGIGFALVVFACGLTFLTMTKIIPAIAARRSNKRGKNDGDVPIDF